MKEILAELNKVSKDIQSTDAYDSTAKELRDRYKKIDKIIKDALAFTKSGDYFKDKVHKVSMVENAVQNELDKTYPLVEKLMKTDEYKDYLNK